MITHSKILKSAMVDTLLHKVIMHTQSMRKKHFTSLYTYGIIINVRGITLQSYYKGDKNHEIPNYIQKHNRSSRNCIH